jgi:hypothetical protein
MSGGVENPPTSTSLNTNTALDDFSGTVRDPSRYADDDYFTALEALADAGIDYEEVAE